MRKAKASRFTFISIFSASSICIIVALYLFVGRPVFKYVSAMKSQFAAAQEKLQQAEELMRSLPNPQKSMEDIERRYAEFREISGMGKQLPRIIQALGQSAADGKINVISIKAKEDVTAGVRDLPPGVKKMFLEMIFSASYQDIGEYARVLNDLPGVFTIETMTVNRQERDSAKTGEGMGSLHVNFIISTYMVGDL